MRLYMCELTATRTPSLPQLRNRRDQGKVQRLSHVSTCTSMGEIYCLYCCHTKRVCKKNAPRLTNCKRSFYNTQSRVIDVPFFSSHVFSGHLKQNKITSKSPIVSKCLYRIEWSGLNLSCVQREGCNAVVPIKGNYAITVL